MKIGIAGYGFVGKAHKNALDRNNEIIISDPAFPEYSKKLPTDVDCVIVSVSTPSRHDGSCEMTNVYEVIETCPQVPILIKSTISLEGWEMLIETFPEHNLTFSPEFLRAETAEYDFMTQNTMYMGGQGVRFWHDMFVEVFPNLSVIEANPKELILGKYFRNAFLATKVSFFNQIYDLCKEVGVDYGAVAIVVGSDPRIGESHTVVTEERGFGGHCFPKDMKAIAKTGDRNNVSLSLIKESLNYNKKIRKE